MFQVADYTDWIQFGQYYTYWFYKLTLGDSVPSNRVNYPNNYRISGVDIDFSQDLVYYEREIYAILQFMGDIGGFLGFLHMLGNFIIGCFTSKNATTFMIT